MRVILALAEAGVGIAGRSSGNLLPDFASTSFLDKQAPESSSKKDTDVAATTLIRLKLENASRFDQGTHSIRCRRPKGRVRALASAAGQKSRKRNFRKPLTADLRGSRTTTTLVKVVVVPESLGYALLVRLTAVCF